MTLATLQTNSLLNDAEKREFHSRLALKGDLERRLNSNPLRNFVPNGAQQKFIDKIGSGDIFLGVLSAGNGVGKTALAVNMLGNIIYPETNNPFFSHKFFREWSFPKRARIASTKKNTESVGALQTEIKQWFPKGKYMTRRMGKHYDSEFHANNWVFDVMTYDQDIQNFESATLGLAIFDEPPPEAILNATVARMRKGGLILIFMTPLDVGGQLISDLEEREAIQIGDDEKKQGKIYIQYASIWENCIETGKNGTLSKADIDRIVSMYDSDEKDARELGKPIHLIGRIYPDFLDEDPYVINPIDIPREMNSGWIHFQVIDPHDAIPFAITWGAIDASGDIIIYDEFPSQHIDKITRTSLTMKDYYQEIVEREGDRKPFVRLLDPFFGNKRYHVNGMTVKEEFAELGLDFDDGDTSGIEQGHKKVREFLKYDKDRPIALLNRPKLRIFRRCSNHRRAMKNYKRKFNANGEVKDKIVIEETYKHFADNIRHICMKRDEIVEDYRQKLSIQLDNIANNW